MTHQLENEPIIAYNIEAKTVDQFLLDQFNQHFIQIKIIENRTTEPTNPPVTTDQTLQRLSLYAPYFAQIVAQKIEKLKNNPNL